MMNFFSGERGVVVCYGEQFELFRPFSMQLCGSMQRGAQLTKKCARQGCRKMMTKALVERLRKSSEKFVGQL